MKKGFAFTLLFVLIASLLVFMAADALKWKTGEPSFRGVSKSADIADDVAQDFFTLMNVSVGASRNATHATLSFGDSLPSRLAAPEDAVTSYVQFIEGEYANATNANISVLGTSPAIRFSAPDFSYEYGSWSKGSVSLVGEADAYFITARLDKECGACQAEGAWNWTDGGTFVMLDIQDSQGTAVAPGDKSSGYINPQQYNYFEVMLADNSSSFQLSAFGNELAIAPANVKATINSKVSIRHAGEIRAAMPVDLIVDGTEFNGVPLLEK
ncbi:Uncharacterised protein [Candidatus Burarchaeum australiense]|nr:Uncharacterised protein [Candidatus Burarchaeum australiense]